MKVYQRLASLVVAIDNCEKTGNQEWQSKHFDSVSDIIGNDAPSGSGFDAGTNFEIDECKRDKLVFSVDFHHMNENGYYDGWTSHKVIVTPSLAFGFDLRITGRDRRQIKDYIHEVFDFWLNSEVED